MSQPRIGQMLKRIARLSELDIEEILQEQSINHRLFGEIAVSMNFCAQRDVWRAWYSQLATFTPHVDLHDFGIDTQAMELIPQEIALQYQLVPLRAEEDQIVAAIPDDAPLPPAMELAQRLRKEIRFVRANPDQIETAMESRYGALRPSV